METVLFGSFLTQYDAIKTSFKEMKPFLNISGETEKYHSQIVLLKILFIVYAFDKMVQKHFSLAPSEVSNFSRVCTNPNFKEMRLSLLSVFVIILFYKGPLTCISAEFLIDIFLLIFSLNYAVEAYKREVQKISAVIFICLYVHWYTNHTASTEEFRFRTYLKIIALLFLSYLPMMPNNRKYRHRLAYLYPIISIFILYKLNKHYNGHHSVMHQNITRGSIEQEQQIELDLQRGKLMDTLKNLSIKDENIHSDTENVESSCYTLQKVVPNKPHFPCNQEQITKEKMAKLTRNSKAIQNEGTGNKIKRDTLDVKEVRRDENSDGGPGTLTLHDTKQYRSSVSPSVVENKKKADDAVFKLSKAVHTKKDSILDESSNMLVKYIDDEMHKNMHTRIENKELNAQPGKSPSAEVPKSGYESTAEATDEEKYATGKFANSKDKAYESCDASNKPGEKKILNGKRTIPFFKKQGEISKGSKIKTSGLRRKSKGNESAIQKPMNSKNGILAKFGSNKKGTAVGIHKKTAHLSYRKVSPVKIERKDGTELQIRNSGVVKGRLIKPERVRTVNSAKNLLSIKPLVERFDKKKDLLTLGNDSPVKNSKD